MFATLIEVREGKTSYAAVAGGRAITRMLFYKGTFASYAPAAEEKLNSPPHKGSTRKITICIASCEEGNTSGRCSA